MSQWGNGEENDIYTGSVWGLLEQEMLIGVRAVRTSVCTSTPLISLQKAILLHFHGLEIDFGNQFHFKRTTFRRIRKMGPSLVKGHF